MRVTGSSRLFEGEQLVVEHRSRELACDMRFGIFQPPQARRTGASLLWLSGLTCTHENFCSKAGAQRVAAELGLTLIAPDTSPRGEGVPDDADGAWDFGLGAGFYVDATRAPWSQNYRMRSYVLDELLPDVAREFALDTARVGISGHSMGGHGALTLALGNPTRFRSVSAFAPICAPSACPWGEKALTGYLGVDRAAWRAADACALIDDGARLAELLVDQGTADEFLHTQLKPDLLQQACKRGGIDLTLRMREGYDHSYHFIATFIESHLRWHAERLA
jgi:S-formylglutathione hydrolase